MEPCVILSLSSVAQTPPILRVQPHQPTRIITRATDGPFIIESLRIASAGTPNGAADWILNDIEIDGQSQLTLKKLPGALFGVPGIAARPQASAVLSLKGFDPVEQDHELALIVTYVGPHPEGAPFFAAALGSKPGPHDRTDCPCDHPRGTQGPCAGCNCADPA